MEGGGRDDGHVVPDVPFHETLESDSRPKRVSKRPDRLIDDLLFFSPLTMDADIGHECLDYDRSSPTPQLEICLLSNFCIGFSNFALPLFRPLPF